MPQYLGLVLAAVADLVIASLGVTAPGRALLRGAITLWPGFAVLRDAQQFIAPLALAEAIGLGLAVSWSMNPDSFGIQETTEGPGGRRRSPAPSGAPGLVLAPMRFSSLTKKPGPPPTSMTIRPSSSVYWRSWRMVSRASAA